MGVASGELVKVSVEDRVAVVTIDHRPVNALNRKTLKELAAAVDGLEADPQVKVVVVTGAGSLAFVAGADIKELSALGSTQEAQEVFVARIAFSGVAACSCEKILRLRSMSSGTASMTRSTSLKPS